MKSFEQKDLLGRTVEQHGACGYVFFGECPKEHQIERQTCKQCKWKWKSNDTSISSGENESS
jgi:hypothetical protein